MPFSAVALLCFWSSVVVSLVPPLAPVVLLLTLALVSVVSVAISLLGFCLPLGSSVLRALIGEIVLTNPSSILKLVLRLVGFMLAFSSSLRLSSESVSYSHCFVPETLAV